MASGLVVAGTISLYCDLILGKDFRSVSQIFIYSMSIGTGVSWFFLPVIKAGRRQLAYWVTRMELNVLQFFSVITIKQKQEKIAKLNEHIMGIKKSNNSNSAVSGPKAKARQRGGSKK